MNCYRCGMPIVPDERFCRYCGTMQPAPHARACKQCGAAVPLGLSFCENCGCRVETAPAGGKKPPDKKPRNSTTLLWVLLSACVVFLACAGGLLMRRSKLDAETARELAAAESLVNESIRPYLDENGGLPEEHYETALNEVYENAVSAEEEGACAGAELNEGCVLIELNSGGCYVFLPSEPTGGAEPLPEPPSPAGPLANEPSAGGSGGRIVSLQPYYNATKRTNPQQCHYPDLAAQQIVDVLPAFRFDNSGGAADDNRDNQECSLEFLKKLADYAVVIWHGHGGYSARLGSFLGTTIPYENRYRSELRANRIVVCTGNYIGLTPAFFDQYLGHNTDGESAVYLATCYSGCDKRLAEAFLDHGFDCVIANPDSIVRSYNLCLERAFFGGMAAENGEFLTSGEALDYAVGLYSDWPPNRPRLFGSAEVCFARAVAPPVEAASTPEARPPAEPASTPASDLEIRDHDLECVACIASVLPEFSDARELSKEQLLSMLDPGYWLDGFSMFGARYSDDFHNGLPATLAPSQVQTFTQALVGVEVPDVEADYADDIRGIYCSSGTYEVMCSDFNTYVKLTSWEQLGGGLLRVEFSLLTFDWQPADIDPADPDLIMTVRASNSSYNHWGYTVVSIERNSRY